MKVKISGTNADEFIEFELDVNRTMSLEYLKSQFMHATGLKYFDDRSASWNA